MKAAIISYVGVEKDYPAYDLPYAMARPFNKIIKIGEAFEDMFSAYRLK